MVRSLGFGVCARASLCSSIVSHNVVGRRRRKPLCYRGQRGREKSSKSLFTPRVNPDDDLLFFCSCGPFCSGQRKLAASVGENCESRSAIVATEIQLRLSKKGRCAPKSEPSFSSKQDDPARLYERTPPSLPFRYDPVYPSSPLLPAPRSLDSRALALALRPHCGRA